MNNKQVADIKDTYKYNSVDMAIYIVALANDRKFGINITKVQKLLYIIYGVYLRIYSSRLINEHPQAWPYGPVFPTTRNRLLKKDLSQVTMSDVPDELKKDSELLDIINFVLNRFSTWNAGQLSEWSHSEGSPWDLTTQKENFEWGDPIDDELIIEYFTEIVKVDGENN